MFLAFAILQDEIVTIQKNNSTIRAQDEKVCKIDAMTSKTDSMPKAKKSARSTVLGVRLTKEQIADWDAQHVRSGQTRSEVVRSKLGIGQKPRQPRPTLSAGQAYDYWRAMRIRGAVDHMELALGSVFELEEGDQVEALGNVMELVRQELAAIKYEVTALQTRSELFMKYPVDGLEEWPKGDFECMQT